MATLLGYAIAVFLAFHGVVHGWYVVLSRGWIEPDGDEAPAWGWNGRSWLLSGALPEARILDAASVLYGLVVVGFVVGAAGLVVSAGWATPVLVGAAVLSTAVIVVMWDGSPAQLTEKGALGVLIDVAVVAWLLLG